MAVLGSLRSDLEMEKGWAKIRPMEWGRDHILNQQPPGTARRGKDTLCMHGREREVGVFMWVSSTGAVSELWRVLAVLVVSPPVVKCLS